MNKLCLLLCVATVCGCATLEHVAPETVAGYRANGVLGALAGASGVVSHHCEAIDDPDVRDAIDTVSSVTGTGAIVLPVRVARRRLCDYAGALNDVPDNAR